MTTTAETETSSITTAEGTPIVTSDGTPIVVERRAEEPVSERSGRIGPFVAGVLTTLAAGAVAVGAFLAVSDSDDDGNIELDVPAVDVRIDE